MRGDMRITYSNVMEWATIAKQLRMMPVWHGGVPCEG